MLEIPKVVQVRAPITIIACSRDIKPNSLQSGYGGGLVPVLQLRSASENPEAARGVLAPGGVPAPSGHRVACGKREPLEGGGAPGRANEPEPR